MKLKTLFLTAALSLSIQLSAVPFKLINTGLKSIALWIPGVMNPNLSPMSTSGVDLVVGQKIYFKYKGKKHILLEVDETLVNEKLNVNRLIEKRKEEIDIRE